MDEVAWEQMPSERRLRFGMFWGNSLERNIRLGNVTKAVFFTVIITVIAFSILFPVVKYTSRSQVPLAYNDITNTSGDVTNCWSNVLSFGYDCSGNTEPPITADFNQMSSNTSQLIIEHDNPVQKNSSSPEVLQDKNVLSEINSSSFETQNVNSLRVGRSKWPYMSTNYPYLNTTQHTPTSTVPQKEISTVQTNIFAIPMDMSNDELSKPLKTPLPYVFTPLTSFSNSYAQLLPYKYPRNYSNLEWVLKYLKENMEDVIQKRSDNPENIMQSKSSVMKVSGTYMMPLDRRRPGEILVSGSGTSKPDNKLFNGHAYDPFLEFRPDNVLEINRLIPVQTGIDIGPRFRRPVSFVPKASFNEDFIVPHSSRHYDPKPQGSASHTVAIFHPPDFKPPLIKRPPPHPVKEKPLSITLDIYPVTMDAESVTGSVPPSLPGRDFARPNNNLKPRPPNERPRWRHPPGSTSRKPPGGRPTFPSSDNRMVVHLNLFPSKRKPYTYFRELERNASLMALLSGGHFQDRDSSDDNINSKRSKTKTNVMSSPQVVEENVDEQDQPEFSALKNLQHSGKRKFSTPSITTEFTTQNISSNTNSSVSLDEVTNEFSDHSTKITENIAKQEKLIMKQDGAKNLSTNLDDSKDTTENDSRDTTENDSRDTTENDSRDTTENDSKDTTENVPNNFSDTATTEDVSDSLDEPTDAPEKLSTYSDDDSIPSEDMYKIYDDSIISTEDIFINTDESTTQFYRDDKN